MNERPILFSAPMVRALLAGTKTQTRRVIKDQQIGERFSHMTDDGRAYLEWQGTPSCGTGVWEVPEHSGQVASPYGQPGDRLWVREAWRCHAVHDHVPGGELGGPPPAAVQHIADAQPQAAAPWGRMRHARFMPRWASRILLEVTDVRVERLQDINEPDAAAEGVATWAPGALSPEGLEADPSDQFRWLWDSINRNGPHAWAANPWVWAVSFRRSA